MAIIQYLLKDINLTFNGGSCDGTTLPITAFNLPIPISCGPNTGTLTYQYGNDNPSWTYLDDVDPDPISTFTETSPGLWTWDGIGVHIADTLTTPDYVLTICVDNACGDLGGILNVHWQSSSDNPDQNNRFFAVEETSPGSGTFSLSEEDPQSQPGGFHGGWNCGEAAAGTWGPGEGAFAFGSNDLISGQGYVNPINATLFYCPPIVWFVPDAPGGSGDTYLTFSGPSGPILGGGFPPFMPTIVRVGDQVIITGTGFTGTSGVSFNGTPAVTFTVVTDTRIVAIVPVGATSGPITVTNGGSTETEISIFVVPNLCGPALLHYSN